MKFGCSAALSEVAVVRDTGFDYVVLRGKDIASATEEEFRRLCDTLDRLGLPCLSINAYCGGEPAVAGPSYDREKSRRYAGHLARRAGMLGVDNVGIGAPAARRLPADFSRDAALAQAAQFTGDAAEIFAREGVRVGFEPLGDCFCNFINYMHEATALLERIPGRPAGLILDFYNMEKMGEADMELTAIAPLILHAHISEDLGDCTRRSPLRSANYPLHAARIRRLHDSGYTGGLTLELDVPLKKEELADDLAFMREVCQ